MARSGLVLRSREFGTVRLGEALQQPLGLLGLVLEIVREFEACGAFLTLGFFGKEPLPLRQSAQSCGGFHGGHLIVMCHPMGWPDDGL